MISSNRKASLFISLAVVFAFAAVCAASLSAQARSSRQNQQSEEWRKRAPEAGPARPLKLPSVRAMKFSNGLTLAVIEDRRVPMVTINVGIPVGNVSDPASQPGLAEATADLITEGAGRRTSEQLAREVETLGGRMYSFATDDYTEVGISVVAENAGRMIELIGDVVMRPTFPESEIALFKDNRAQNLIVQRQDPAFLVSEQFNRIIYGPHPYAISAPTPESVAAINKARLKNFHRSRYSPAASIIVIAGNVDAAKIEAQARKVFGAWKAAAIAGKKFPAMPERKARRVYLIDRPGSEQADFRIGNLGVARSDADYFPLLVANTILGGGTGSRLFLNIREQKGYAYDVSSSINAPRLRGTLFGSSQSRTEVTMLAIKEMIAEFDRMREEKVSSEDLQNAKNYLNGVFSLVLSTQGGLADQILRSHIFGLGRGYLENYRARVEAVTTEQVQQAARKYMLTDRLAVVVVGDAAKLKKELEALGPVEALDIQGKPAKAAHAAQ